VLSYPAHGANDENFYADDGLSDGGASEMGQSQQYNDYTE